MQYIEIVPTDGILMVCSNHGLDCELGKMYMEELVPYTHSQAVTHLNDDNSGVYHSDLFFLVSYKDHPVLSIMEGHEVVGIAYDTTKTVR